MGPVYDQPRDELTRSEVDASLRYQIMEVVDQIRWIPGFGYERELDWLLNMHDWMISKKRYCGLALPIYDCQACGDVRRRRRPRGAARAGGRGLGRVRGPHAAPAVRGRGQDRLPVAAARRSTGSPTSATPGSTPGSCRSRRSTSARIRDYWQQWFPADFITESFPGQFRNWFYSMLAMSTVLRREPPFRTIFGYALVFGEDGRPMHKSWGNAIEFDEAAERMGVDVMRWLFAKARPEDNILFGWHAADEARRELLVLWNVYAFFVTYARLAGWTPVDAAAPAGRRAAGTPSIAGSCRARPARRRPRSRTGCADFDAVGGDARDRRRSSTTSRPGTCGCSRRRFSRSDDAADREAAFATLHARARRARPGSSRPILPFLAEAMYGNLVPATVAGRRPTACT